MNTPREERMRAEFEEWFASQPENGGKRPNRADRGDGYYTASTQRMWESWQAATQRERERCARICDEINTESGGGFETFAEAIRSIDKGTTDGR